MARTGKGGGEILFATSQDLKPDAQPGQKALLVLTSTEIPVDLDHKVEGNDVTLRLLVKDEEIEVEKYRSTTSKFELVSAAGESFDPPLPLLEFPVEDGVQFPWKGRLRIGEIGPDAEAKITVKKESLNEKGYDDPAVKVTAVLVFDGGAPQKTERTLRFWFVQGKGVFKREFDKGSARKPVPPGDPSTGKMN
jgi:hypothetical protein